MAGRGSIVVVLNLVAKFYSKCTQPSEHYGNLSEDVVAFSRALEDAKPALLEHDKIDTYNGCLKIIGDIQNLLAKKPSPGTSKRSLRNIINWQVAASRLPTLTESLHRHIGLLNIVLKSAVSSAHGNTFHEMEGHILREVEGVPIYEMKGTLGYELAEGAIYEIGGALECEVGGGAVYEMSASIEHREILRPEAPGSPVCDNNIPPLQRSEQREFTEQTRSLVSTIDTEYNLDLVSTGRSARHSSSSQTTISSGGFSFASTDRTQPAVQDANLKFITALKKGSIGMASLLKRIKDNARISLLDQESINMALIVVSKHEKDERGQTEALNFLLDQCAADVESRDIQLGRTPLIWAICVGREDIVRVLLGHQALIEARDAVEDCTPLMWAIIFGHEAIIELLISQKASLEAVDKFRRRTPLLWAAKRGAFNAAKILLRNIQDPQLIDAKDGDGKTALALAYTETHPRTAKALLQHGADPNFTFKSGLPLLVSAVMAGLEGFVRLLVEKGANVNCLNLDGIPVLSIAVYDKPLAMVRLLVDNGADLQTSDPQGRTPLLWAVKRCRDDIVELLIGRGANRNVADIQGLTAQHWAWQTGHKRIIHLVCLER